MSSRTDETSLILRGALIPGREGRQDVLVSGGIIRVIGDVGAARPHPEAVDIDLNGYVLCPSFAEAHTHLDKALLAQSDLEPGDLAGAIGAFKEELYSRMDPDEVAARAMAAVRIAVSRGITQIRSHVDCYRGNLSSLRAVTKVRDRLRGVIDIQVVALVTPPIDGSSRCEALMERVAEVGPDVIGGCPGLERDPRSALKMLLSVAATHGFPVDVHVDETLDTGRDTLGLLAHAVMDTDFTPPVTASHCVSLGRRADVDRRAVIASVRQAGINVVTLPQTNLLLQGRNERHAAPRGLPPLRELLDAGVVVAGGSDNWRDPFNPLSRIDPLETVKLLVEAGHLRISEALDMVSANARVVMGLDPVGVAEGGGADLVALRGESLIDALADMSDDRVVISHGRLVSKTQVDTFTLLSRPDSLIV